MRHTHAGPRRQLSAALLTTLTWACSSAEDVSPGPGSSYSPECDCYQVRRDNPVLTEDVLLAKSPFAESAKRTNQATWSFDAFDLGVQVSGGAAPYARNEQTDGQFLHFWPGKVGAFQPAGSPTGAVQEMPWELHGVRLGYSAPARVRATKERSDHLQALTSNETGFTIEPAVIVVPIQVVVVRPDYDAPEIDSVMDLYRREVQDVIWDDRWKAKRQVVNHPGGYLAQVQGQWLLRTQPVRQAENYDVFSFSLEPITGTTLPDDVFDQCQIQFRLVRYQELALDREHVEFVYSNPDGSTEKVCSDYQRKFRYKHILTKALEAQPRFDSELPIVVFNYASQAFGCSPKSADSACSPGDCLTGGSVFYGYLNAHGEKNADLILAHELGHVLNLDDETCNARTGQAHALMCGTVGGLSTFIPTSRCEIARTQAQKYLDRYLGGRSP